MEYEIIPELLVYSSFPLRNPSAFPSTASVEVLELCNTDFSYDDTTAWPSVLELNEVNCFVYLGESYSAFPNLQIHHITSPDDRSTVVRGSPLSAGIDVFEVDFKVREEISAASCPIRCVKISKWDLSVDHFPYDSAQKILDFLWGKQVLVLSFNAVNVQHGLDLWESLYEMTPDLRCLELSIVPTLIKDSSALVVSTRVVRILSQNLTLHSVIDLSSPIACRFPTAMLRHTNGIGVSQYCSGISTTRS